MADSSTDIECPRITPMTTTPRWPSLSLPLLLPVQNPRDFSVVAIRMRDFETDAFQKLIEARF